ncbi:hypothetical protein Scep_005805 [Stephania cephalantha]|uniref:Uncharacterized protein n=1 Tax=Stephania cephalantha TaxID=152367 RepID=A0AAP0KV11_9MAGN
MAKQLTYAVGEEFCHPYSLDLIVERRKRIFNTNYKVLDNNGKLLLQVNGNPWCFQRKRVVVNSVGQHIATMRLKVFSWCRKWTIRRADHSSSERGNALFTVQNSHVLQFNPHLDIFMANNLDKNARDFNVVSSRLGNTCKVYKGDAKIAEMNYCFALGEFLTGLKTFRVQICAGVDYALIVSLLVVINENC